MKELVQKDFENISGWNGHPEIFRIVDFFSLYNSHLYHCLFGMGLHFSLDSNHALF